MHRPGLAALRLVDRVAVLDKVLRLFHFFFHDLLECRVKGSKFSVNGVMGCGMQSLGYRAFGSGVRV